MSTHKNIDRICVIILAFTLVLSFVFCSLQSFGIQISAHEMGYEKRLFDSSKVHRIDIVIDDWDKFLETCESEQYSVCSIVIDGDEIKNAGIRGKGNTSLSSVKNMNSSRYSFKIEFDQYENGKNYYGLDKLCLNNIIQDNTYMKDFTAYTLMKNFRVDAPLCSYADVYVNGEEWGLYLAVESVEDSFLKRNYGNQYGDLYKPDSMSFGGGRGNGMDFDIKNFTENRNSDDSVSDSQKNFRREMPDFQNGQMPDFQNGQMPDFQNGQMPDFQNGQMPDEVITDKNQVNGERAGFGGGGFGMGSDDVKLKYTDDRTESYSNIFNNAKTTVTAADQKRLINSLKLLAEQSNLEYTVDTDEVIRYFVVHNFIVNGDSYTGQMIHNYYLYEENGQLSMIPWDYNLGFGTFQGGSASSSVNYPIDSPVSGDISDRPMISWIFDDAEYTEEYHRLFSEFIDNTDLSAFVSETAAMIDNYVKNDATKFCTYEEFQKAVEAMKLFCELRTESVKGQLNGTIPSTTDGQNADKTALIDASELTVSDMGTMNMGRGQDGPGGQFDLNSMSERFSPDSMPDGIAQNNEKNSSIPENEISEKSDAGNSFVRMPGNLGGKPEMGNFNPMRIQSKTDTKTTVILLISSAVILIGGLTFAFKFRR